MLIDKVCNSCRDTHRPSIWHGTTFRLRMKEPQLCSSSYLWDDGRLPDMRSAAFVEDTYVTNWNEHENAGFLTRIKQLDASSCQRILLGTLPLGRS